MSERALSVFDFSNTLARVSSTKSLSRFASRIESAKGALQESASWTFLSLMEWKCVDRLADEHTVLNYLRASEWIVCLLVNFHGPEVEWKRIVFGFPDPFRAPEARE